MMVTIVTPKKSSSRASQGQNVIEYILLLAVALLVFMVFLKPQGKYTQAIENSVLNSTVMQVNRILNGVQF